ncbi:MAG TPA: O-antigen ligase family protein [Candidatus Sulfotelmatobacter sp.]|jgi:O-antigen ligase
MAGTALNPTRREGLSVSRPDPRRRNALIVAVLCVITALAMGLFYALVSDQVISILGVGVGVFALLGLVLSVSGVNRNRNLIFALWWILLSSEGFFSYMTEDAEGGQITSGAYSEVMVWVFIIFAFALYSIKNPQYFRKIFSGSYKWVAWFGVVCFLSCAYAEQPFFSLGWIVKLFLAIALLAACNQEIKDESDLRLFLRVSQWAFAFLVFAPLLRLMADPAVLATGRLFDVGTAPTMLAADAGILVLLSLALSQPGRRGSALFFAIFGMATMILAAGKAGFVACVFSGLIFFIWQGKFKSAVWFLLGLLVVGAGLMALSPGLASYITGYLGTDQAGTVTGRTDVWTAGWQLIKQKMILGRGFMSSRFLAYKVDISWQPGHLHNGFLEVWYNNGLVGLFVMLMMHGMIIRNLVRVMRRVSLPLAAGCFAVYLNILINGMVSRAFGSRPDATFTMMFALVFISERLLQQVSQPQEQVLPSWPLVPAPAK